ncbi:MAG: GNAT family N-acetyltransferase [Candidatus Lokiarchaeota archaeon]|nr:GNAT family N-acetyltransferase [Candidatus Lokiarchaeota archaeon]
MTQKFSTNIEIACVEDAIGIYNTFKQNLVEIRDIDRISKRKKKELIEVGFLRKEVDIDYYISLIKDPTIDIFVAKINNGIIIGFASIYRKIYNIVKVRDVIGSLSFENERTKNLLLNEDLEFSYLDQVSILPEYKRKGVGTAIFQKSLTLLDTPVVAFIVEKPLFNKASIYWHEYNGFEFSAISEGQYKGKTFKFQIFIHWNN